MPIYEPRLRGMSYVDITATAPLQMLYAAYAEARRHVIAARRFGRPLFRGHYATRQMAGLYYYELLRH